jgi:diacylglycerol kinase (ATP)
MSTSDEFKGKKGLVRLWNATGYSRDGNAAAWKHEAAFREEVLLAAITLPLAFHLGRTAAGCRPGRWSPVRRRLPRSRR